MKKVICLFAALMFAVPVVGQEMPAPPQALEDDFISWLVGEWDGTFDTPMGKSKDWTKYELGLDGQFLFIEATSETDRMNYRGMGAITLHPETGEVLGKWFDNFRGIYEGSGERVGDIVTMEWDGTMGKSTRIIEKLGPNKYKEIVKQAGPDGTMMEFSGEFTRKEMTTKKSE